MLKISFTNAEVSDHGYGLEVNGKSLEDIISTALGTKVKGNGGYGSGLPSFSSNSCDVTVRGKNYTPKVTTVEKFASTLRDNAGEDPVVALAIVDQSIDKGWKDLYPLKNYGRQGKPTAVSKKFSGNTLKDAEGTAPQKHATWDYTFGSGKFNRPLTGHAGGWYNKIGNKKVSLNYEGAGDEIRKMTTLIDKSEYDFDIWLQRGCGSEAIDSMLGITGFSSMTNEQLQKFVGKGGRQYNFISAGVAKGKGFSGEVICNIYAPKGTKMIYAEPFSYYSGADYDTSGFDDWDGTKKQSTFGGESEMIIQRGAYYRITKIEKSGYTTYIDMEVVLDKGYDKFQQRGAFKGLER